MTGVFKPGKQYLSETLSRLLNVNCEAGQQDIYCANLPNLGSMNASSHEIGKYTEYHTP